MQRMPEPAFIMIESQFILTSTIGTPMHSQERKLFGQRSPASIAPGYRIPRILGQVLRNLIHSMPWSNLVEVRFLPWAAHLLKEAGSF